MTKTRRGRHVYTIYMIRHGTSCGNLAMMTDNMLDARLYTDPELTQEGRRLAVAVGPYAEKAVGKSIVVGASNLLRAQQTAYLLLRPKKLYIVPHINEIGWSQSVMAMNPTLQETLMKERLGDKGLAAVRDFTYMEKPRGSGSDQFESFLSWMGLCLPEITQNGQKKLVLVSHFGFMDELIKSYVGFNVKEIRNYDMIKVTVSIRNKKAVIQSVLKESYAPDSLLTWDVVKQLKGHGCRNPIGARRTVKKQERSTCQV